jgi:hypothetical protein
LREVELHFDPCDCALAEENEIEGRKKRNAGFGSLRFLGKVVLSEHGRVSRIIE